MLKEAFPRDPSQEPYITIVRGGVLLADLDNVGFKFIDRTLDIWRAEYPYIPAPNREDLDNYEIGHNLSDEDKAVVRAIWHRPEFYRDLEPEEGFVDSVHEMIAEDINVFFCSSPQIADKQSRTTCHSEKIDSVAQHFDYSFANSRCILTPDKTLVRADALVDDKPTVTGLFKPFWDHIYYDHTWNREHNMDKYNIPREHRGVARLHRWSDWRKVIRIVPASR